MPFPVFNNIGDDHFVHMGSKICLRHLASGRYVRSSARAYQGGSGQQVVLPYGSRVRLYHMATFKWLHSHQVKSPSSGQNEVSAYGNDNLSDNNDNWIVEKVDGGSGDWHANDQFLLRHEGTGAYLHSHDVQFENFWEVTTFAGDAGDRNNIFGTRFG
ncbi:hypothetical protein BGZ70_001807 [Mortierella alpina]|uniref:MIR domain-containing protein n=1 Tax=Mortierella alpina TaxID=64518 RepID=A0A9P6IV90_MORAP|nr:hypothetical protein BGZ70_001807 [Mortierella alpina]